MSFASVFLTPASSPTFSKSSKLKHQLLLQGCRTLHRFTPSLSISATIRTTTSSTHSSSPTSTLAPHVHHWNTMIHGFTALDRSVYARNLYHKMCLEGLFPNDLTISFVLKACTRLLDLKLGINIHTHVVKSGFTGNLFVETGPVCANAKFGWLDDARKLFDGMINSNVVTWTAIICGYVDCERFQEALTACSRLGDSESGEWVCRYIEENMGKNAFVATAIVDMYAKCGSMEKGCRVFYVMIERDEVTWNTMVDWLQYSFNVLPKEALTLFSLDYG